MPTRRAGAARSFCASATSARHNPGRGIRHEFVEARGRPQVDEFGEDVGEVGLRVDAIKFTGLNERSDASPVLRALIVTGEECIFAIENDRANASFDNICVELDPATIENRREPAPVVQGVADVLGDGRLGRDAGELLFEPGSERQHEGFAAFLAHRATLIGAAAPDRLLDGVESSDALERLAGDGRGPALGDVEETASQMGPAKSQGDRLVARAVGDILVSRISIALHDAAIAIKQLERADRTQTWSAG